MLFYRPYATDEGFQFLIGRLITIVITRDDYFMKEFQFLIGRLITRYSVLTISQPLPVSIPHR